MSMGQFDWIHLVYLLGVLLLISPAIAYVFRAPHALRNITIWLAIIAGLGWAYKLSNGQFDQFINMPTRYQGDSAAPREALSYEDEVAPKKDEGPAEDNPIRNP